MSKIVKFAKKGGAKLVDVIHPPYIRVQIPAQMAKPVPPLGNQLGQRNINAVNFCKEFNERTSHIKPGILIPCLVFVNSDRTYRLDMIHPTYYYLLLMASGAVKGSLDSKTDVVGVLSLKHLYEIAKFKQEDIHKKMKPLKDECEELLHWCRWLTIKVQPHVTPEEIKTLLENRKVLWQKHEEAKEVKAKKK